MATVVLVCGGRDFNRPADRKHMCKTLDAMLAHYGKVVVIHGGAPGADSLCDSWCMENGVYAARMTAMWGLQGKAAGPLRNAAMAALRPDVCIAFKGGPGTANMVKQARDAGIPTYEV